MRRITILAIEINIMLKQALDSSFVYKTDIAKIIIVIL